MIEAKNIVILVSGIILSNKKILLLKRSLKNKTFKGFWQLPEGKIEFSETPEDALKREVREELNTSIARIKLLNIFNVITSIKGIKYQLLRIVYSLKANSNEISLSIDHDQYDWFTISDARKIKNLIPGTKEILAKL